ncbi:hypothetical protein N7466_001340 [Penicillium verhagenii]|uniref:uncharacterized protein n=1 Tax=Penicillium verhagenii TaxID=1562060 RepID=UPI002545058C|nr:uncharacterized protein N7466_001340 [Penicillium verhagenii]KAJ5948325.1 hypothetical protein N7466_001340 [Penicillium verhagenii]
MALSAPMDESICTEHVHDSTQQSPSCDSIDMRIDYSCPVAKLGQNRLRPASDIINRIIWDSSYSSDNYTIVFLDRFQGELEISFESWKKESTDEEFIPQHRVLCIKQIDGKIVWDRRRRVDLIFKSGNSAFSELAFLA